MLQGVRAINGLLHPGDPEATEDVEPAHCESQFFQNGVQAIFQDVPLRDLIAIVFAEQQAGSAIANKGSQPGREFFREIDVPADDFSILALELRTSSSRLVTRITARETRGVVRVGRR